MPPPIESHARARLAAGGLILGLVLLVVASFAFVGPRERSDAFDPIVPPPSDLDLGTHAVGPDAVTDGDSLRVPGVGAVRVIGIDCEEVFRSQEDRAAADRDFASYARSRRGDARDPVKFPTPAGEAAREAARGLVASAGRVRLEPDDANVSDVDAHGRTLAHVVLLLPEGELLLAEALIARGHSPYFVKYGRCRRFDRRLERAERRARERALGIWSTGGPSHYPDYPERLRWWHARADQVDAWRDRAGEPGHVALEDKTAEDRLRGLVGRDATVFGLLRNRKEEGVPRILWLRHVPRRDFAVVCFDPEVWDQLDHGALDRLFVTVTGRVTLYRNRPQILVERATQVGTP